MPHDGIFHHKCKRLHCKRVIQYDDEPYCFEHSDDSGSSVMGYSAMAEAESAKDVEPVSVNIFDKEEDNA